MLPVCLGQGVGELLGIALGAVDRDVIGALHPLAGEGGRENVNLSYVEPWVSFVTKTNTTLSISAETNYDWEAEGWSVPVNLIADQLFQTGEQYIAVGGAIKYWAESSDSGPEGFGFRLQMTLLFPKK